MLKWSHQNQSTHSVETWFDRIICFVQTRLVSLPPPLPETRETKTNKINAQQIWNQLKINLLPCSIIFGISLNSPKFDSTAKACFETPVRYWDWLYPVSNLLKPHLAFLLWIISISPPCSPYFDRPGRCPCACCCYMGLLFCVLDCVCVCEIMFECVWLSVCMCSFLHLIFWPLPMCCSLLLYGRHLDPAAGLFMPQWTSMLVSSYSSPPSSTSTQTSTPATTSTTPSF